MKVQPFLREANVQWRLDHVRPASLFRILRDFKNLSLSLFLSYFSLAQTFTRPLFGTALRGNKYRKVRTMAGSTEATNTLV